MFAKDFTAFVEQEAREIIGEMSNKEYLAQRVIAGTMPALTASEELGIHHKNHKVPGKVLKSLEDKAKKATAKNATTVAEAKKRKGVGGPN